MKRQKKGIRSVIVVILLSVLVSCSSHKPEETDSKNESLRIVSLAPSLTREVQELGLTENIVGATSFCDITQNNKELIVGSATKVNIEKVMLLHPDIVLALGLTDIKDIETLKHNNINVVQFESPSSFDDICSHLIKIGNMTGRDSIAKEVVRKATAELKELKGLIPEKKKGKKIFFQIGANPIFAVLSGTFMNDYITFAGCTNIASDLKHGTMTRESVLQRNPDIIFIATMGIMGEKEKALWKSYKELNAVKNNKVFIIDSNIACTPTVTSFVKAFKQIIEDIYKTQKEG